MRKRTLLPRRLIEQLLKLRLIASTGPINAAVDVAAATERGIEIVHTGYSSTPTIEMTRALILANQRHLMQEVLSVRSGGWQQGVGGDVRSRTPGLLVSAPSGARWHGSVRFRHARYRMEPESHAGEGRSRRRCGDIHGAAVLRVDIVSIHMLLSRRTRGLVDADALALMKRQPG